MVEIRSPFPSSDVPRIWAWMGPFMSRVSDDFGPKTLLDFITHWRIKDEVCTTWGVYRDGELGGLITYEQLSPVVGTAHVVFRKSFWGQKTTIPAITEAVNLMFERCEKLSVPVFEGNKAMISLLMKIGATKEGVLKMHTRRDGKPIDVVMLAMFKGTFGKEAA